MVDETYDNDDYYDVTYVVIVFISLLPTIFMPWFFMKWILIGTMTTDGIRKTLLFSICCENGSNKKQWRRTGGNNGLDDGIIQ